MLRKLLPLALLLTVQPALADTYLLFKPGETISTEQWNGPAPEAAQILPCTKAIPWTPAVVDGKVDLDLSHYVLDAKDTLSHSIPEPPPPGPPGPNIPAFFDGLVKAILSGAIPGDVHSKALMVKDLKSPADQAAALAAFSSDPVYTKEQKLILDTLIKESNLALPDVPGKE